MKRITLLSAGIAGSMLFSCKGNPQPAGAGTAPAKTYLQLGKAEWFLGEWGNKTPEGELTERWKKVNDSVFTGESYFVIPSGDTVFSESVRLEETGGKLAYIVTLPGQNDEKPVRFEMTSADEKQLVFENPQHDFPSRIVYSRVSGDSLVAEISGMRKGKPASEQFAMKKR